MRIRIRDGSNLVKDIALLVLSCDKYKPLWKNFLYQFEKHFPIESSMRLYFGSNELNVVHDHFINIKSGNDNNWSTSLKRILSQISESNIIIILEDLYISEDVDLIYLEEVCEYFIKNNIDHIQYLTNPSMKTNRGEIRDGNYKFLPKLIPFRITVCGIWNKSFLENLLIDGESPWNFEIMGSYRGGYSNKVYGLVNPIFNVKNMVEKGKWMNNSLIWAKKNGLRIDTENIKKMTKAEQFSSWIKFKIFNSVNRISWSTRLYVMNNIRKLLSVY